jgi:aminoglycoside phosphotransferase (APT) family kinase protein
MDVDPALIERIEVFAANRFGEGACAVDIRPMLGGHAGLTFGFRVENAVGDGLADLILKLAPEGVRREGNTDVYRQGPLLRALYKLGLPVPDVPFCSPDEDEFGVPFIMMNRLPGREFFIWDPDPSWSREPEVVGPLWRQMAEALPRFHQVDWRAALGDWEAPRPLEVEINRWTRVYAKAPEPSWARAAEEVKDLLLASLPDDPPIGLVHGDYQPGNGLFEDGRLVAVIDWELSRIGTRLLDVGWLMMGADPLSWAQSYRPINPPSPDELREIYERGMGRRYTDIPWHQALANYQLGSITCLNITLHRTGRRVDAVWEQIVDSAPRMFERARQILQGGG